MFKYRIRMFFNELKVLVFMRSDSRASSTDVDRRSTTMRGLGMGGCGWPPFVDCHSRDDEEEYYGSDPRPRSLAFEDKDPKLQLGLDAVSLASTTSSQRTPQCRICFQGPEQGELLSPCRCDGSVRCTHQPCLIRWISERGSWSCELCYFKYQVLAISTKNPLQWQAISLTVIEKVQIAAIILGSLFLIASISWLIWSSLSPSAKWQRQDLLFQICYGMYGFMDIVCIDSKSHPENVHIPSLPPSVPSDQPPPHQADMGVCDGVSASAGERDVIQTHHTHAGPTPGFLQGSDPTVASTYFDQRVPVPEDHSRVGGVDGGRPHLCPHVLKESGPFLPLTPSPYPSPLF
ncbi:unnamed protein product [Boreogadus saida]